MSLMIQQRARWLVGWLTVWALATGGRDALAANQTWSGATSTAFSLGSNWVSGTAPTNNLINDVGVFDGTVSANQPSLTAGQSVNGLAFTTPTGGWTLGGSGYTLSAGGGGISTVGQTSGTNTISANIEPRNNGGWKAGTGGTLLITGSLVGSSGLIIGNTADAGTLVLTASSGAFSGGVTLRNGTRLHVNNASAIGTGQFALGAGPTDFVRFDNTSNAAITLATNNAVRFDSSAVTFDGTQDLNLGTGTVTLARSPTISITAKTLSLGGPISATANTITKTGSGTLVLGGVSGATGQTTITTGALQANDGTGLNTASFLSINGGVLQSNGAASFTRTLAASGSGQFQWSANGGGFSAAGGQLTVNVGNDARELTWGSTAGTNLVGTLKFGSPTATAKTVLQNGINLTTTGTVTRTIEVTAGLGGDSAEIGGAIRNSGGRGNLTKTGAGLLVLSGSNSYTGLTTVSDGQLIVNGSITGAGGVSMAAGTVLGGAGSVAGGLSGAGTVSPGNSPGILTVASVDLGSGLDFAFEFSKAGDPTWGTPLASGNDVLRLTNATSPILGSVSSQNVFDIYFSDVGATYRGGIFTDLASDFGSLISGATYNYFVKTPVGGTLFNGQAYEPLAVGDVTRSVVQVSSATFSGVEVENGYTMQFVVVPEPDAVVLCVMGIIGVGCCTSSCRRRE